MVYVCVICMCPSSLESLSAEHREILECLVSTSVNLVELQNVKLLVCRSCVSLIKAVVKFKQTAIAGVTHVLHLWSKQKKIVEQHEALVKDEPSDKDINSIESDFVMEIVPEFVNIQDDIKTEQDVLQSETTQNWDNIEEAIPKSTIQVSNVNTGVVIVQKPFTDPVALRSHMRGHRTRAGGRPRPHVCDVCGKAFTIKKSLTEHMYMHSGLRPYKCQECPDTFTYRAALLTHNRLKHLKIKRNEKKKPKEDKNKKSERTISERNEKNPKNDKNRED